VAESEARYSRKAGGAAIRMMPTLVDFSCFLWNAESDTSAYFLLYLELLPLSLETRKGNTINQ
jgi:hypothetical protein